MRVARARTLREAASDRSYQLDALVVGIGFDGICMPHKLREELGLEAAAIDDGRRRGAPEVVPAHAAVLRARRQLTAEQGERIFQRAWDEDSGFRFAFESSSDIPADPAANEEAAFIRRKIAEIVEAPSPGGS